MIDIEVFETEDDGDYVGKDISFFFEEENISLTMADGGLCVWVNNVSLEKRKKIIQTFQRAIQELK